MTVMSSYAIHLEVVVERLVFENRAITSSYGERSSIGQVKLV